MAFPLIPAIGAAAGLAGSLFGGGGQKTTNQLDRNTRRFRNQVVRPEAIAAADRIRNAGPLTAGPTGTFQDALAGFQGLTGQFGDVLSGIDTGARDIGFGFNPGTFDPNSAQGFFNPFDQQVIQGIQSDFDRQRALASNQVDEAATRAGIFGGSRAGVMDALTQGEIGRNEAQALGQFRNQGFQNAMQQAMNAFQSQQGLGLQSAFGQQQGQVAGEQLGQQSMGQLLGGIGQLGGMFGNIANLGEMERQIQSMQNMDPIQRDILAQNMLQGGFGPTPGFTSTTTQQQNPISGAVGGATVGSQLFGNVTPTPASNFNPQGFNPNTFNPNTNLFGGP